MANICDTTYAVISSNKEKLYCLRNLIAKNTDKYHECPIPNLLDDMGIKHPGQKRNVIVNPIVRKFDKKQYVLRFTTITAWNPEHCTIKDIVRNVLGGEEDEDYFILYLSIENGGGFYFTNDEDYLYFEKQNLFYLNDKFGSVNGKKYPEGEYLVDDDEAISILAHALGRGEADEDFSRESVISEFSNLEYEEKMEKGIELFATFEYEALPC